MLTDAETHEEIAQASEVVTVQREVVSNLNEGLAEDLSSEEEELITNTSSVEEVQLAAENILNAREQKALQEAKNAAIDQIDANEAESARINQATSVEEVSEAVEAIQTERVEKALQDAKDVAIEVLEADGETTEQDKERINQASTIEEVQEIKEDILDSRKNVWERIGDFFRNLFK